VAINEIYYLQTGDAEPTLPKKGTEEISSYDVVNTWTTIVPSYRNNGAYWSCLQCVYDDDSITYTGLTLISPKIDVETTRIEELY
jgi:hypothetical protein